MVEVRKYQLPPTTLIPNSPQPLLHYPSLLSIDSERTPVKIFETFSSNGWQPQWIFRYGTSQPSHYHSSVHECMAVLTGTATIRFGVADTVSDLDENTHGGGKEEGGIEIQAKAGDVFVIPAGVAHKTFDTQPTAEFKLLTPGDAHQVAAQDMKQALADIELSGFTMLGAYPNDGNAWDFSVGGDNGGSYEKVWSVPKPKSDPVLGGSAEGLRGQWR